MSLAKTEVVDAECSPDSSRVEINSSVIDSLLSVHGEVYVIFYGRI